MTLERRSGVDRLSGADSSSAIGPASYVLIVDADADRVAAAIRGVGDALPAPALVARNGDDAMRILRQFGPPALLMTALALPGQDGLSVIESLRRIDDNAPVIAWAADRDLREYAASRLPRTRAKILGGTLSSSVLRRCVDGLLRGDETSRTPIASNVEAPAEHWMDLAERARQRLGVVGAAAYAKARDAADYRLAVSWMPDAPMPNFPVILLSALEEVMASGVARVWTDLVDESRPHSSGAASLAAVRSLAIVPILRERETAGALCVFDSKPHALRTDDLETLSAIAGRSASPHPVPVPMIRHTTDAIVESAVGVSRDQLAASVLLFAIDARRAKDLQAVGDLLAGAVRGDDVVVRRTNSEVVVVLAGVDRGDARRVAERIRSVVETKAAKGIGLSGAVTELRTTDSFDEIVARAAERLQQDAQDGHPRIF
jgi:CheY-like chemotaxis protein